MVDIEPGVVLAWEHPAVMAFIQTHHVNIDGLDYDTLKIILNQSDCSVAVFETVISGLWDTHLIAVVLHHPDCPTSLIQRIGSELSDSDWVDLLATAEQMPADLWEQWARSLIVRVRRATAAKGRCPPSPVGVVSPRPGPAGQNRSAEQYESAR